MNGALADLLDRATSTCRLWAEQDEGPYRRDHHPVRCDVTEDRTGVRLGLGLALGTVDGTPLAGGIVEIWHCDAAGRYSGFPPPEADVVPTSATASRTAYLKEQTFLRGTQTTDRDGRVEFQTIYPGWYPGRTVHIHVIVRINSTTFTSQLYFPEAVTGAVFAEPPYSARWGRDTTNAVDEIFPTGGEAAVLDLESCDDGYLGVIALRLPASAT